MIHVIKTVLGDKYSEAIANRHVFSKNINTRAHDKSDSSLDIFDGLPAHIAIPSFNEVSTRLVTDNFGDLFMPELTREEQDITNEHKELAKMDPLDIVHILTEEIKQEDPTKHIHAASI